MSAAQLSVANYRKGMYLLVEGKNSNGNFFILREGRVELSKQMQFPEENSMSMVVPGDFVGIVPAMAKRSQIESAQALVDSSAIVINRNQFGDLIQNNPQIAIKVIQQFSRRIRFLNDSLARFSSSGPAGKKNEDGADRLFHLGEFYRKTSMNVKAYYVFKRYMECYPDGLNFKEAQAMEVNLNQYSSSGYENTNTPFQRNYKDGGLIFAEGEMGRELYIIKKGSVKICRILDGNETILAILKEGDIFGEMAVIDDKPRSATAVALGDACMMAILKENFAAISETQPQIITNITRTLSERIWFSYKQLSNALIKDPVGRIYNYLAITLEKNNIEQIPGMSYIFSFSAKELMKMASIPADKYKTMFTEIFRRNGLVSQVDEKLVVNDVDEIYKLGIFYKNRQERETANAAAK
ncbi:MAG: Crp/Fnr family transcriptional regulator [Spirochaetaceae bacterium]|jgi:CRP-like cAMP-binding protein|nr:Crp/Fnr family transcriptional regulator [Spirochaetaceae bacterium]